MRGKLLLGVIVLNQSKKDIKKGFTVAELLTVVAIIAILSSIVIPNLRNNTEKAREAYDVYTMRQAASAAIDLFYAGINGKDSALAAGLSWSSDGGRAYNNAYGAYDPRTGKIYASRNLLPADVKTYGKGTTVNGGTKYSMGNTNGSYKADEDYTNAVVMISIYPYGDSPHAEIYWKNNKNNTQYVGGQQVKNQPKYSIRVYF